MIDYNNMTDYDNFSEEEQIKIIKKKPYIIQFIKNPSEKVCLEAVKKDGFLIFYIKNPPKEVQLEAVKEFYILNNIKQFIKTPCQEILDMLMIKDIIE